MTRPPAQAAVPQGAPTDPTRRLDVVAGGRPRSARRRWLAGIAAATAVLVAGAVVAACTADSASSSGGALPPAELQVVEAQPTSAAASIAPEFEQRDAAGAEASAAAGADGGAAGAPAEAPLTVLAPDNRQVIRTASLSVQLLIPPVELAADASDDDQWEADVQARRTAVDQAATTVRGIAASTGGYVAGAEGSGSSVMITVRVPVEQYEPTMERLAALGEVTARTESAQDVTTEIVDVNSRVETMTASVARVRALLAEATAIGDVIAIEAELAVREANLESLKQQQAYLTGQVALSTVTVSLEAVTDRSDADEVEPAATDGFLVGLAAGWSALLDFLRWIGSALGALLPFLPIIAAVIALVWWLLRRARRRRRPAATTAPPLPTGPAAGAQDAALQGPATDRPDEARQPTPVS